MPRHLTWLLPLAFLAVYIAPLGLRPLSIPDEARYAEISREMLETGDWCTPRALGVRYFEKPAGGYWLNNLSLGLFGENAFAVRLASALSAGLSALLIFLLTRRATADGRKAVAAALVYLSGPMVLGIGTQAVLDMMLSLWLTAGLGSFWLAYSADSRRRRLLWWAIFGACCGAAFLTKGFVALAIPVLGGAPFMLWQRRWATLVTYGWVAVLAAAVVSLPWALAIHAREPDFWRYFFWVEHIQRFSAADAQHGAPFWYYLPFVALMALPWLGAAPSAFLGNWRSATRDRQAFARYVLVSFAMPLVFFSISRGKLATYILPCCAPLAIMIGCGVVELLDRQRLRPLRVAAWICLAIGAIALLALVFSQTFSERRLYVEGEAWKVALVGFCLAVWVLVAVLTVTRKLPYVVGLALLPVTVVPAASGAIPASVEDSKMPKAFIQKHRDRVAPGAVLASGSVSLSFAVAWELQRSDVVIVGGASELEYGMGFADAAGRHITWEELDGWIDDNRREHPVALFLRVDLDESLEGPPTPDWSDRTGQLALLYYEAR